MALSRPSTSAISLEDWDALAPLDERAKASIAAISDASSEKPLPKRLLKSVPAGFAAATPNTRPGTPTHPHNLLRRAASRMEMHNNGSAAPSAPETPRPRSPAQRPLFSSPHQIHQGGAHTRHQSTATATSALAMQILPSDSPTYPGTPGRKNGHPSRHRDAQHDPLEITSPIETTQQFLDWYSGVEASMESEQEEVFRRYETEVGAYIESCDEALELLEDSRGLIKEMEANYRFVEENSRALQMACEAMLEEQKHLLEVTDAINSRLEYFKELETATRALSQPGDTVVLQEDFLSMLQRLDICLDFLRVNRNYRDAEVYLIRFQQCLTRAMTLIRMHFLQTLNATYTEVSQRLTAATAAGSKGGSANLSETALNALLYAKFSSISETSRSLLYELEKRANANPSEYGSLLQECFSNWFNVRTQLLAPSLAEEVRRMDPQNTDLVKLARSGCAYLRNVCASEWKLFREFFPSSGQADLYHYLETLCDCLYDSLRPRILHETKLETLCELCNVIQALISLDGDNDDDEGSEDADASGDAQYATRRDESSFNLSIATATATELPESNMRFSELLGTVLQDVQTRLVFRAQYIVEAEVLNYAPEPEELDYPALLVESRGKGKGKETPSLAQWQKENGGALAMGVVEEDGIAVFKLPPQDIMENWYPTLRKTLWVLSRLHSYVNSAIFQDFAGEAVNLCRQSLNTASEKIAARPGASKLDGQLFVIRHLLILKEMVRSMDLVQIERAMDFSNMTDALASLLRNTSTLFNPNALYQLASKGIPSFAETMRDAKMDLDSSLKLICEDFMTQSSLIVSSSIRAFLTRCQSFLTSASSGAAAPDLTTQDWASGEEVMKLHDAFIAEGDGLEKGIREILEKLNIFLDEEKTVAVLIPPMLAEVLDHYTTFYDLVRSEYDYATANAMTPPARVRERLRAIAGSTSAGWTKERSG